MNNLTKIMLVEDDDAIRAIATRTLEKLGGFEVINCESGVEALKIVLTVMPDLIIMDIMMPGLTGVETLQKLKELKQAKEIPVIFSTARVQPSQIEEYQKMDIIGIISKPFDPIKLSDTVKKIWEQHYENFKGTSIHHMSSEEQNELDALYTSYSNELPHKLNDIIVEWEKLRSKEISVNDWHNLYFKVHKLAGSSGSFGYTEEGELLRTLELIVGPLKGIEPSTHTYLQIEEIINALRQAHKNNSHKTREDRI